MTIDEQVKRLVDEMIAAGHFVANGDGSYHMSPYLERFIRQLIEEDPAIFPKLFPERVQ